MLACSRVGSIGWIREKPEARTLVRRPRQQACPRAGWGCSRLGMGTSSYHRAGCPSHASPPAPFLIVPAWKLTLSFCTTPAVWDVRQPRLLHWSVSAGFQPGLICGCSFTPSWQLYNYLKQPFTLLPHRALRNYLKTALYLKKKNVAWPLTKGKRACFSLPSSQCLNPSCPNLGSAKMRKSLWSERSGWSWKTVLSNECCILSNLSHCWLQVLSVALLG